MIYDCESTIKALELLYKEELNNYIDAINTEKNDSLVLENIDENSYIFETLTSKVNNFKGPFVLYGLVRTEVNESQTDNFLERTTVTFQVALIDKGENNREKEIYKLLRYRRALVETIVNNPDIFQGYSRPQINQLNPEVFEYNGKYFLTIGVNISASITTR